MKKIKLTALERSWILYDIGNSAFILLVSTLIPIYFNALATTGGLNESLYLSYWGYAGSVSTLLVAVIGPICGTLADHRGFKKPIFMACMLLGVLGCAAMGVTAGWLAFLVVFVLAKVGYSSSLVFYDAMLPEVTTDERMDTVSSMGYAYGYIGSVIPFILCLLLVLFGDKIGIGAGTAMVVSFLITAVWWFVCTQPLLKRYRQTAFVEHGGNPVSSTFRRLRDTFREVRQQKHIFLYLLAFFFFIDGVYTIIDMATAYGTALGLNTTGLLLALLAPQELRQTLDERQSAALEARLSELRRASDLFSEVSRALDRARPRDLEPQSAAVFDQAADRVCRSCGRWKDCWQTHAQETYLALSHAAGRIFQSGCAARDDLPAEFTERCCYPDGFLAAVNEALETQRTRRQYQTRLAESRSVLSDQFRYLSRLLQGVCDPERDAAPSVPAYTPDLGYRARGVRGGSVSGDHGSCFTCGEWYYLLLCDGMGTGEEASRESASAIHFLSELLLSGFEAQDALQMLNGVYILRGDGGFSTVDLLQISLVTGEGFLHKWGAAPSYLRQAHRLVKLGAPTPPPGLGVDGRGRGECLRVSMGRGEMLVLVSDGVAPEETERWIRGYKGRSPRELASGILGCGGETGDDRTAAVLCLRPCTAKKTARAAGNQLLSRLRL